eukprot:1218889-Amphidinium_carterae.1
MLCTSRQNCGCGETLKLAKPRTVYGADGTIGTSGRLEKLVYAGYHKSIAFSAHYTAETACMG